MMRNQISVTPSEEIDSKRKLVDVAKERVHTETELRVIPRHVTFAVNGENDISSSSAQTGRSAERWRRLALLRSGDMEPENSSLLTSPLEPRRNIALPSTISTCSLLSEIVVRVVLSLHKDSSSLLRLPQNVWNGVLGLVNYPLVLRELWSTCPTCSFTWRVSP